MTVYWRGGLAACVICDEDTTKGLFTLGWNLPGDILGARAEAGPRLGEAFQHDRDEQLQYMRSPGDSHRQKPTGLTVAIA